MSDTRRYNFLAIAQENERQKKIQEDRIQASGVEGISNFYVKSGVQRRVRILHPLSFGLEILTHSFTEADKKFPTHFICERQFSTDPQVYCPICQDLEEAPEQAKKDMRMKRLKNLLLYVYDWEGQVTEKNTPMNTVGIFKVGPGDPTAKNWTALDTIVKTWNGLSTIDLLIRKTGEGLQTVLTYEPLPVRIQVSPDSQETYMKGEKFDWNRIKPEVKKNFPEIPAEPGNIDPTNPNDLDLINAWGDFFVKAGRYKTIDSYKKPNWGAFNTAQVPYSGLAPAYTTPNMVPQQTAYQQPGYPPQAPPYQQVAYAPNPPYPQQVPQGYPVPMDMNEYLRQKQQQQVQPPPSQFQQQPQQPIYPPQQQQSFQPGYGGLPPEQQQFQPPIPTLPNPAVPWD